MVDTQDVALGAATTIITLIWACIGYWFYTNLISSTQLVTSIFWSIFLIIWITATLVYLRIIIEDRETLRRTPLELCFSYRYPLESVRILSC